MKTTISRLKWLILNALAFIALIVIYRLTFNPIAYVTCLVLALPLAIQIVYNHWGIIERWN